MQNLCLFLAACLIVLTVPALYLGATLVALYDLPFICLVLPPLFCVGASIWLIAYAERLMIRGY